MRKPLFFLITLLLASCTTKEDVEMQPITEPEPLLIKSVKEDGVIIRTYGYDDEDRLEEDVYYWPENVVSFVYKYEYEDESTIITGWAEGELYNQRKIYRADDSTVREDIYFNNELARYVLYRFEDPLCGYTAKEVHSLEGEEPDITERTYLDDDCSWRDYNFAQGNVRIDSRVTLDDKNNFEQAAMTAPFFHSSGNKVALTHVNDEEEIIESFSFTSEFVYNNRDYPVSEIRTYLDGRVVAYEYEYY